MNRTTLTAAFAITALSQIIPAHAVEEPEDGCPGCDVSINFFDPNAPVFCPLPPDDSSSPGINPSSVGLWGAAWVDDNKNGLRDSGDIWRISLVFGGIFGTSIPGSTTDTFCRHFERPWTMTGERFSDYMPKDQAVIATAGKYYGQPKMIVRASNGWRAYRIGDDSSIVDPQGNTVLTSTYSSYVLTGTQTPTLSATFTRDVQGNIIRSDVYARTPTGLGPLVQTVGLNRQTASDIVTRRRRSIVEKDSSGTDRVTTHLYGYYNATPPSDAGGVAAAGQLRYILRPQAVAKFLADYPEYGVDPQLPENDCGLDTVPDSILEPYASTIMLEYGDFIVTDVYDLDFDCDTSDQVTVVKIVRQRNIGEGAGGGCGACGEGAAGTWTTDYYENPSVVNPRDTNEWLTRRSSVRLDQYGVPTGLRKVAFLNMYGQPIYEVEHETSAGIVGRTWIEHVIYDASRRTVETRRPSACRSYSVAAAGGWVTGVTPDNSGTEGLVELRVYDPNQGGQLVSRHLRNGTSPMQPTCIQEKNSYIGQVADLSTNYFLTSQSFYPTETADENAPDRLTTSYAYTFYPGTMGIESRTVSHPAVSTSKNGSGVAASTARHYRNEQGQYWNDWTRHEDGTLDYNEIGFTQGSLGKVVKTILDADTSRVADFAFPPPAGWTTPAGAGKHRITETKYYETGDAIGRQASVESFDGTTRRFAYLTANKTANVGGVDRVTSTALITLTSHHMDGAGKYDYLPLDVRVDCVVGRALLLAQGLPATGADGDMANDILPDYLSGAIELRDLQNGFHGTLASRSDNFYNEQYQLVETRKYHTIPAAGVANDGEHYLATEHAYDPLTSRRDRTRRPDNTVSLTVVDDKGRVIETRQGVTDAPLATLTPGDLALTGENVYDNGDVGDGNLTASVRYQTDVDYRETFHLYDWRNRQVASRSSDGLLSVSDLDNLGRAAARHIAADLNANFLIDPGELRGLSEALHDERGRVWKSYRYEVDPVTGAVGDRLTSRSWFDPRGRTVKTEDSAGLFRKSSYDSTGQQIANYVCHDAGDSTYNDALDVAGDTVLEETVNAFDDRGLMIQATHYQRLEGSAKTGSLAAGWTPSDSRRSYRAMWHDVLGRRTYTVDYGDNGGMVLARPAIPPEPNTSDDYIVSKTVYGANGLVQSTFDNLGIEKRNVHDAAGRVVKTVEAYVDGVVTPTEPDTDRTTLLEFDYRGNLATMILLNPKGPLGVEEQKTRFLYEDSVNGSTMTAKVYPDSTDVLNQGPDGIWTLISGTDHAEYAFNLGGELVVSVDQRGVVHEYAYDVGGRLLHDATTVLPAGVDGTVQRIGHVYDDMGRPVLITSFDAAAGGNVVNEIGRAYNGWGRLAAEWQSHTGPVGASTPGIQYNYDDGAVDGEARFVRLESVAYPGGEVRQHGYGAAGSTDDIASRMASIAFDGATVAEYRYRGYGTPVGHDVPAIPAGLGKVQGIDRFGRVDDLQWAVGASVIEQFQYTHDRGGRRVAKALPLDPAYSETYGYDMFHQLVGMNRNNGQSQSWDLEHIGNWSAFTSDGSVQTREHNAANELTAISDLPDPEYDEAGNMVYGPDGDGSQALYYVWDAWNRLTEVRRERNNGTAGRRAAIYRYDGQARRIASVVRGGGRWNVVRIYYDGWNIISAGRRLGSPRTRSYVWGLDLSGSLQGAGGIGGLLAVRNRNATRYPLADANGNVTTYLDETGVVTASYRFDPYGKLVAATGPEANVFRFRFSSKWRDSETGFYYYGYRFYSPEMGRWPSRDPLREFGAILLRRSGRGRVTRLDFAINPYRTRMDLYVFVRNQPATQIDPKGLDNAGCDGFPGNLQQFPCLLECCALHDKCFDDHDCTFASWARTLLIMKCRQKLPDFCCPCYNHCDRCNTDVLSCFAACASDPFQDDPNRENYYCAAQDRFVTIGPNPGDDFPDLPSAQAVCGEAHGGSGNWSWKCAP